MGIKISKQLSSHLLTMDKIQNLELNKVRCKVIELAKVIDKQIINLNLKPMPKNIQCPSCSSVIAKVNDGRLTFAEMKAVSKVEINMDDLTTDAQCHTCHNWSSIDKDNNILPNYKRKAQDVFYSQENLKTPVNYKKVPAKDKHKHDRNNWRKD